MTKSIEEQAEEYATQLETNHRVVMSNHPASYYVGVEVGYESGAKARDAQWIKIVNELIEALNWQRSYLDTYLIISPKITNLGIAPEENIKSRIDDSLTKADQMLKEMGIDSGK